MQKDDFFIVFAIYDFK